MLKNVILLNHHKYGLSGWALVAGPLGVAAACGGASGGICGGAAGGDVNGTDGVAGGVSRSMSLLSVAMATAHG